VDPVFIIKAFERGADGVLVGGCHPGDCHYVSGNYNARRRFFTVRRLLDFMGIDSRRFQVTWCSAAEGEKWAEVVDDVCDLIENLGPHRQFKELGESVISDTKKVERVRG
jgi:coenzyme F420-reducing hydrogenase delta subunit